MKTCVTQRISVVVTDINDTATLNQLLNCLCYALNIDESVNLPESLGMVDSLSNREALSIWVKNETYNIRFLDASALFNFLIKQLDNLEFIARRPL